MVPPQLCSGYAGAAAVDQMAEPVATLAAVTRLRDESFRQAHVAR
ncbi:hypothetical protein EV667_1625 [Ancylobacter aquaticus]|uniref:Uncharacterized protein n=1 Tax=Ancylobacter aquaticus TaxID=100 RepID=A0A4R1IBN2_ANCAQ|nr:hypothetical protein EV667_1625 [Ancylobacter aquaticus]